MISTKYIGMDVHKESISIAVLNVAGKVVTQVGDRARARVVGAGAVADGRGVGRDASAGGTADRASRTADSASDPGRRSDSPSRASASTASHRRLCALGEAARLCGFRWTEGPP